MFWEAFFSGFVSGSQPLSIRHYAITLMHGLDVRRFAAATDMSFGVAIVMAMLVFAGSSCPQCGCDGCTHPEIRRRRMWTTGPPRWKVTGRYFPTT